MVTARLDMIVPGLFATGLTSQTFLPGVPTDRTPCLDAITARGRLQRRGARSTLDTVCERLHINVETVQCSLGALCWRAEFDEHLPPWVAIASPVTMDIGRTGLTINGIYDLQADRSSHLLELLQPVFAASNLTLSVGPRFNTFLVSADSPLDVELPQLSETAGRQLRDTGIVGKDSSLVNSLRTDVEMALHDARSTLMSIEPSHPVPDSFWLWGASQALPTLARGSIATTQIGANDPMYHGLALSLGLPTGFESLGVPRLAIDTTGIHYVRSRNVERWYHWVCERDTHWQTELGLNSRRPRICLLDPLGVEFTSRSWSWPWQARASFFDRVNAIAAAD